MSDKVKVRNATTGRVFVSGRSFDPGDEYTVPAGAELDEHLASGAFEHADVRQDEVLEQMTGAQVDAELERRGLPRTGTVPERRDRLREAAEGNQGGAASGGADEEKGGDGA